jgi:hypothetical protein
MIARPLPCGRFPPRGSQSPHRRGRRSLRFRKVPCRGRAAIGLPPCPAIAGLTNQKLRNTGLTWLRKAKADDDEFMAVSGHTRASLPQVMPHYYTPGADEAVAAMTKLSAWMQRRGIKL